MFSSCVGLVALHWDCPRSPQPQFVTVIRAPVLAAVLKLRCLLFVKLARSCLQTQLKGLPEWISRARELTGLKGVPLDDVLPVFADAANSQGSLDRDAFNRAFLSFIPSSANKREVAQLLSGVLRRL